MNQPSHNDRIVLHDGGGKEELFGERAVVPNEPAVPPSKAKQTGPARLPIPAGCVARGKDVKAALYGAYPDASVEEKIIFDFVANEMVLATSLEDSAAQLVTQFATFIDNPKLLLVVTKSLKDVMGLHAALGRRVEGGLAAAANLRAQRAFLRSHGGSGGKNDD